jgi:simple sugar transport system permease protein
MGFLKIERRLQPSWKVNLGFSILAIFLAFFVIGFIFLGFGINPIKAYIEIFIETVGNMYGITQIIWQSIPLLLCGVGLLLAFKASFWNIGAEGQLLMGAVAATWVALFSGAPDLLMTPLIFIFGFLGGALWGLLSTVLKAKFRINEVITTLMMNYIAMNIVLYLIHGPWKGEEMRGFAYTNTFPESAQFPTLGMSYIHWPTLLIGLILVGVMYVIVNRTKLGYEVKVIGQSQKSAQYAHISYFRTIFWVMLISGGCAGIAGAGEVAGVHHMLRHPEQVSLGYGYTGIIVAWLARGNPILTIVTSFLFGIIYVAGDVVQLSFGLPFQMVNVITGLILFFLISSESLMYYKISFKRSVG